VQPPSYSRGSICSKSLIAVKPQAISFGNDAQYSVACSQRNLFILGNRLGYTYITVMHAALAFKNLNGVYDESLVE
jgi:hypothetical protein